MEYSDGQTAAFLHEAIREMGPPGQPARKTVLDVGCGSGELVGHLSELGYDAYGCDITPYWSESPPAYVARLATISQTPYRLPYEASTFDVVVSTSVLEHAQNKEELFAEIFRVIKAPGSAMHLFPSKWYLPAEPHIYVPLVNFFWPKCPRWWLALWAMLGVRNEFQEGKSWREVTEANVEYCRNGLSYWSSRKYRALSLKVFGNYSVPMDFYIRQGHGRASGLLSRLPLKRLSGWMLGQVRTRFMIQRRLPEDRPSALKSGQPDLST